MKAATTIRQSSRMLIIDPQAERFTEGHVRDVPALLSPGAVMVVNDSGTGAASVEFLTEAGEALEARFYDVDAGLAVVFGAGDWRTGTEVRARAPALRVGDALVTAAGDVARVMWRHGRRVRLVVEGGSLRALLTRRGRPVQYAYHDDDVPLGAMQSPIAGAPLSVEMPSASRLLTVERLITWRAQGLEVHTLTHGAGLSSIGPARLDRTLPWREHNVIPQSTWDAVLAARAEGRDVIALGTTVARALEGRARGHRGSTDWVLGAHTPRLVTSGIVTGIHDLESSHHALLGAYVDADLLARANRYAQSRGFYGHEFGDFTWVSPGALRAHRGRSRRDHAGRSFPAPTATGAVVRRSPPLAM